MSLTRPADYDALWQELPTLLFVNTTKGEFFVIDGTDWPIVQQFKWQAHGRGYASARVNGRQRLLHQILLPDAEQADHRNCNKSDHRRSNLRPATFAQNMANRAGWGKSGFKGVFVFPQKNRTIYRATLQHNGQCRYLGIFPTAAEAARAYDVAALAQWGEFARLNFPDDKPQYLEQLAKAS